MPVYRLTPVAGTEASPQWRTSSMHPYCLWIRASDENEARRAVAQATAVAPKRNESETLAPWKDSELVTCEYDDSKDVAPGIICVRRAPAPVAVMPALRPIAHDACGF